MGSADWSRSALCDLYAFANFSFFVLTSQRLSPWFFGLSVDVSPPDSLSVCLLLNNVRSPNEIEIQISWGKQELHTTQEIRNSEGIIAFISAHQHNQRIAKQSACYSLDPEPRIPDPCSLIPSPWSLIPDPWSLIPDS